MPSITVKPGKAAQLEVEHLTVQRLACASLVQGCERSLFELRRSLGEARNPADVRTGLQAAELLEGVLASWRDTLDALSTGGPIVSEERRPPTFTERSSPLTTR